jgi:hypothetical protein
MPEAHSKRKSLAKKTPEKDNGNTSFGEDAIERA